MRAIVSSQTSASGVVFAEIEPPVVSDGSVKIAVTHFALNPGELRGLKSRPEGSRLGWDIAGVVQESRDAAGRFHQGMPVVACVQNGGWAEEISVDARFVSPIPGDLEPQQAVCLPVPGMTAFCALRFGDFLVGRRVLITAAAGAVGQFACQLALAAGASVTAIVRRSEQVQLLEAHGVVDVRVMRNLDDFSPSSERFDLVVDSLGGPVFEQAIRLLSSHGRYVVFSAAAGNDVSSRVWDLAGVNAEIKGFDLFSELERGGEPATAILARLLGLLDAGQITCPLGTIADWNDIETVVTKFLASPTHEKPVLRVGSSTLQYLQTSH